MSRTRASARAAGSRFEQAVADYLAREVDDRIERRVKHGANDRGDISGVRMVTGERVVIESKDYGGVYHVAEWLKEAETERGNDDATIGVVVAKRRGVADPAQQVVFMTLEAFSKLIGA